ncbi:GapR family DNA-binding domain-containing protein, partial [Brucella anthropi]
MRDVDHTGDNITSAANTIAAGQLRAFIERIERLEEEKSAIGGDIKEVYAELKG